MEVLHLDKNLLINYMPNYYKNSTLVNELFTAITNELTKLETYRQNNTLQFNIATATETSMARWEQDCKLQTQDNYNIDYRRSLVQARLKGIGTCTKAFIQNVANSYQCGDITIIEPTDGSYNLIIKFTSLVGVPPNIDDFKNTISSIIPAHFNINYQYTYNTWQDILNKLTTWQNVANYGTWQDIYSKKIN